jgi:hypothetical protein
VAALTINQLVTQARRTMDAVGSDRWSDQELVDILTYVYDANWARLLQAAPYYRFQSIPVTTATNGTFPLSSLSTGTGNNQKNFFRILSVNDGNVQYSETRYQDVPLGTTSASGWHKLPDSPHGVGRAQRSGQLQAYKLA